MWVLVWPWPWPWLWLSRRRDASHLVRVATEACDVVLDPLEVGDAVEEAPVARSSVAGLHRETGMCEGAEGAEVEVKEYRYRRAAIADHALLW